MHATESIDLVLVFSANFDLIGLVFFGKLERGLLAGCSAEVKLYQDIKCVNRIRANIPFVVPYGRWKVEGGKGDVVRV